jgi:hypothetical protein
MGALRKLTRQRVADAYVRMLLRAYEFSSTLVGENIDEMEKHLIECDAFKEPKEGMLKVTHTSWLKLKKSDYSVLSSVAEMMPCHPFGREETKAATYRHINLIHTTIEFIKQRLNSRQLPRQDLTVSLTCSSLFINTKRKILHQIPSLNESIPSPYTTWWAE